MTAVFDMQYVTHDGFVAAVLGCVGEEESLYPTPTVWSDEAAIRRLANELVGATAVGDVQWRHLVHALGLHLGMQDASYTNSGVDGAPPRDCPNIATLAQLLRAAEACFVVAVNKLERSGIVAMETDDEERFMDSMRFDKDDYGQVRFQHFEQLCPSLDEPQLMRMAYFFAWQDGDSRIDM
jgi:hypothetical protein